MENKSNSEAFVYFLSTGMFGISHNKHAVFLWHYSLAKPENIA